MTDTMTTTCTCSYSRRSGRKLVCTACRSAAAKKAAATRKLNDTRYGNGSTANPFAVGDILTGSWGYDQTNVEFHQVVSVGARSVVTRKIAPFMSSDNGYQTRVYPAKSQFVDEPTRRMVNRYGRVSIVEHGWTMCSLDKWDGGGKYETSFGAGH